jgi:cell division septum initiation protein DivIVA
VAQYERDLELARMNSQHALEMEQVRHELRLEEARVKMYVQKEECSCVVM